MTTYEPERSPSPRAERWVFASFVGLVFATAVGAQDVLELRPGVLVDRASQAVYLMHPEGGTDAVSLSSGALLWHSDEADRPLAVDDGRLLAMAEPGEAGRLSMVVLDVANGKPLTARQVELPADIVPRVGEGLGTSFDAWARPAGKGSLDVGWSYSRRVVSGMPLDGDPQKRLEAGAFRFALADGAVSPTKSFSRAAARQALLSDGERLAKVPGRQFRSVDGRHLLASERVGNDLVWNKYRWQVYGAGGERLGEVAAPVAYVPFAIVGSRLLYGTGPATRRVDGKMVQEPLTLRAIEVTNGSEQWSLPLRDLAYRGPFPP